MEVQKNVNGVNVGKLFDTIDLIKQNPEIAKFKFRVHNTWLGGTHNQATVENFYGALEEDTSRSLMARDMDEPPVLLGTNQGPNPVEYLLVALSGCLTTSMIAHASAKGIELKGVESWYEGNLDLRGFLGISNDVDKGYQKISVMFRIDGDLSREQKEELISMAQKYSPVYNTITNSAPISVQLAE